MFEFFYNLISSRTFFVVGVWLSCILTVIFLIMIARKKNRDERGWKIFGKASIISFIWMIILINIIANITGNINFVGELGYIQYANSIQWIYNTTLIAEILSVFILRRIE